MTNLPVVLDNLKESLGHERVNVALVMSHLDTLLEFLQSPDNNTHENCTVVNQFVLLRILCDDAMRRNVLALPEGLARIIQDMGMCLHDTHESPSVASAFASTPQQLLARLRALT